MDDYCEYTFEELLEDAKNDPSWEPDPEKREMLARRLKTIVEK